MSGTASVRLVRKSEMDIKMRDLYVLVDDLPELNIKFGREKTLELPLGHHVITVTNRALKQSIEFELTEAGAVFEIANTAKGCLSAIAGLGLGPYKCEIWPFEPKA